MTVNTLVPAFKHESEVSGIPQLYSLDITGKDSGGFTGRYPLKSGNDNRYPLALRNPLRGRHNHYSYLPHYTFPLSFTHNKGVSYSRNYLRLGGTYDQGGNWVAAERIKGMNIDVFS